MDDHYQSYLIHALALLNCRIPAGPCNLVGLRSVEAYEKEGSK